MSLVVIFAVVLSGCAQTGINQHAPTGGPYGFIYKWLGTPFQNLILATAKAIGGKNAYAWGIVIISFVVRLLLLPLSLNQQYKSTAQQEKMRAVQPQLKLIQAKQKEASDPATQQKISALMMDVYKKNNISLTGGIGCLPLLLQMPVLIGIYQAVQYSKEIGVATFLSIPLGKPSLLIAIIATVFYVIQAWLSLQIVPQEQRKQMQTMMFMNPLITFFISMVSSAALALYFLVGGIVFLIQQVIVNYFMVPKIRREADENLKEHPIEVVVTEESLNEILNSSSSSSSSSASDNNGKNDGPSSTNDLHKSIRELNQGKQNKPKK
nr:membrane protein insertase YidC [Companilactobacillus mishanensis]